VICLLYLDLNCFDAENKIKQNPYSQEILNLGRPLCKLVIKKELKYTGTIIEVSVEYGEVSNLLLIAVHLGF
jgi:hypothetical protein